MSLFSFLLLFWIIGFVRSCSEVSDWNDLKQLAQNGEGRVVLCPFQLRKPNLGRITVQRDNVTLSCEKPQQCIIGGSGQHFHIKANWFVLDGFVLHGATETSVYLASVPSTMPRSHEILNSAFRLNYVNGAVRVNRGNSLRVTNSLFEDSRSVTNGGAVAFYGQSLHLENSTFVGNMAMKGGAVFVGQGTNEKSLLLVNTTFASNVAAAVKLSAAISVPFSSIVMLENGATGINNDDCEGWFDRGLNRCFRFRERRKAETFKLGLLSSSTIYGIRVSQGLSLRRLAQSGEPVAFMSKEASSRTSNLTFHSNPDGAHIFQKADGGYVYVSNSEDPHHAGGVYALDFDRRGFIRNYSQLLNGTSRNCNGGSTPWNTWVSCEEVRDGRCWQVDPFGERKPNPIRVGKGEFEAFAADDRNPNRMAFFVTEDQSDGALRRYRPPPGTALQWSMLHNVNATLDFLEFIPNTNQFRWTSSLQAGRHSARVHYQFTEGIVHHDGSLMFISKTQKELFRLDLDAMTYTVESTYAKKLSGGGSFGNGPDHLLARDGFLYFTEDGGANPGIFVYDGTNFLTLLQAVSERYKKDETTGIAFSPDGRFIVFCIQERGHCFQASRLDGEPFGGRTVLKWKYAR